MKNQNHKLIYVLSIFIGASGGPLFLFCFSGILWHPIFDGLNRFIGFLSMPVFYLLADILDTNSIPLAILLLIPYWAILGICFVCGSLWCYFFISSKFRKIVNSSRKTEVVDI
jgi:hypothetical protein